MKRSFVFATAIVLSISFLSCGKSNSKQQSKGPLPEKRSLALF